jgi:hypothetical protein
MKGRLAACLACGVAGYVATKVAGSTPLGAALVGGGVALVLLVLIAAVSNASTTKPN